MSVSEKILSNIEVHGVAWCGSWAKRSGISFDTFYYVIFGKYPVR